MEKLRIATQVTDIRRLSARAHEAAADLSTLIDHGVIPQSVDDQMFIVINAVRQISRLVTHNALPLIERGAQALNIFATEKAVKSNRKEMRVING